jgi:purine catabolism regulator
MDSGTDHRFDSRGAGITVQRALELPGLRRGLPEILAGADRLGLTVRWVHAGEVPHIASLLKGGELLLTTGYDLGVRPAEQGAFVRTLAERRTAALVMELGPRFARLPAALVDTARAAGLSLVQLHREVPFVTVTEEIHTEISTGSPASGSCWAPTGRPADGPGVEPGPAGTPARALSPAVRPAASAASTRRTR